MIRRMYNRHSTVADFLVFFDLHHVVTSSEDVWSLNDKLLAPRASGEKAENTSSGVAVIQRPAKHKQGRKSHRAWCGAWVEKPKENV